MSTLTTPSPVEPDPAASTQGAPSESAERPESPDSGGTLTVAVCIIAAVAFTFLPNGDRVKNSAPPDAGQSANGSRER